MATVHRDHDRYFVAVKGAPEEVLALTDRTGVAAGPFGNHDKAEWLNVAQELAADGLRVLALASNPCRDPRDPSGGGGLAFVGLVALRDPARADIADAVASLRRAGICVAMATGNHPSTALTIARDVGIAGPDATVTTGQELSGLTDAPDSARKGVARQRVQGRHRRRDGPAGHRGGA